MNIETFGETKIIVDGENWKAKNMMEAFAHKPVLSANEQELAENIKESCGVIRTLESMRKDGYEPLLNVEPLDSEPPPIHLHMGLTKTYVLEPLNALCSKIDFPHGNLPETLKEQKDYLKILKNQISDHLMVLNSYKKSKDLIENVKNCYGKMEKMFRHRVGCLISCDSPDCCIDFVDEKFQTAPVFSCSQCSNTYHTICSGFYTTEAIYKATHASSKCADCQNNIQYKVSDRKQLAQTEFEKFCELVTKQSELVELLETEKNTLENQLQKSGGETRRKLEEVLVQIGCDPRAHYQNMTGNQTYRFLKSENVEKVLSIFPPSLDLSGIRRIMENLSYSISFSNNEVKTTEEISEMDANVDSLEKNLKLVHPTLNVLPKLHIFCGHLMKFVKKNNNWGRSSEQGMEAFHKIFRNVADRYASVQNVELRAVLMIQYFINTNQVTDMGQFE